MLSDHSTAALQAELDKRKALEPLEAVVRQTLADGISMQDIRLMLARVANDSDTSIRNLTRKPVGTY